MVIGLLGLGVLEAESSAALPSAGGVHYYIDSNAGNDTNSGTAENFPWKSLEAVNKHPFQPGDAILFRAGGRWLGQLHPKGSGLPGRPIVIDKYGHGPKPLIDAGGAIGNGAVYLHSQECWEICNLDISNNAPEKGDRRGIYLMASSADGSLFRHLVVRDCAIHHIKGIAAEHGNAAKRTAGILVEMINAGSSRARFDDILIENCTISTVDNIGIALNSELSQSVESGAMSDNDTEAADPEIVPSGGKDSKDYPGNPDWEARKFTHVVIRNNRINDIAKNAMIIRFTDETGLIERNVCWDTAERGKSGNTIFSRSCKGTVFQYNEGYLNHARGRDGSLYDADLQSPGCIFQYSYSHDNNEGLFWQCTDWRDDQVIVRYNISQNDKEIIFCLNYPCRGCSIYNNTVFIGSDRAPTIISERRKQKKERSYSFSNNIIYNLSNSARYYWFNASRTFDSNLFFGIHPADEPADPRKLTSDPMLVAPGTARNGLESLDGYRLRNGSPCIKSGQIIPDHGGFDLWHHPLPLAMAPDRGANQYSR